MAKQVPFYDLENTFEVVYKKSSTSTPASPHAHNATEIYFTLTDLPDVLLNDTVFGVSKGTLIVIPPHCVHQLYKQKDTLYERFIITINSSWIGNIFSGHPELLSNFLPSSAPTLVPLTAEQSASLRGKLNAFLADNESPSISHYADFFALFSDLDNLITHTALQDVKHTQNISTTQKNINEIIAYINEHLTDNLSLDEIASHFFLNKDYLGRLFKEHTHATIGHYIAMQKTSLAQSMLSEGKSVSEVQEKLGFSSYAYFFKFFKKMTGISPSHYRKTSITAPYASSPRL